MASAPRRFLIRAIRFFVLRPLALVGLLVGLVAVVAALAFLPTLLPRLPGIPGATAAQSEPQATGDYLRGNRDYNADLVWGSLSADARQQLVTQGGSAEDLQRQMEVAKQRGVKIEEIAYIGGKPIPSGGSMQVYVVGVRQQPKADLDYQPYMFTLDRDGKITKVQ